MGRQQQRKARGPYSAAMDARRPSWRRSIVIPRAGRSGTCRELLRRIERLEAELDTSTGAAADWSERRLFYHWFELVAEELLKREVPELWRRMRYGEGTGDARLFGMDLDAEIV